VFWSKKTIPSIEETDKPEKCRSYAEELHHSGKYHCAEAVFESIRREYSPDTPESLVASVSGFGGGSSSGCICGAVSGGTVVIGLLLNDKKETSHRTRELHTWFKGKYGATCCKIIRKENEKGGCPQITGEVAGKIAAMLERR
jgi:C_GCAxxG_C_C family probable redox protein